MILKFVGGLISFPVYENEIPPCKFLVNQNKTLFKYSNPLGWWEDTSYDHEYVSSVYLDYNATTPLEEEVTDCIQVALKNAWANPSSTYPSGNFVPHTCI